MFWELSPLELSELPPNAQYIEDGSEEMPCHVNIMNVADEELESIRRKRSFKNPKSMKGFKICLNSHSRQLLESDLVKYQHP